VVLVVAAAVVVVVAAVAARAAAAAAGARAAVDESGSSFDGDPQSNVSITAVEVNNMSNAPESSTVAATRMHASVTDARTWIMRRVLG